MQIDFKLAQLEEECKFRCIPLLEGYKYKRKDYVNLLARWSIEHPNVQLECRQGKGTWGLGQMLNIESPMLCYLYSKLTDEEIKSITDDEWLAQEKVNGVRCIVTYYPGEHLRIFTRAISPVDWLPEELTGKFLIDGVEPEQWNLVNTSFILDCELVLDGQLTEEQLSYYMSSTDRTHASSSLLSATSIVVYSPKDLVRQCPVNLKLKVLDVLWYDGKSTAELPYNDRRMILRRDTTFIKASKTFEHVLDNLDMDTDLETFYSYILEHGGEGAVYRKLDKPYLAKESRKKDYMIKRKPPVIGTEVDGYISGVIRDEDGKIVTLNLSVCDPYGERIVGRINFFSDEDRNKLFRWNPDLNQEELWPGWLGQVVRFTGSDFDKAQGVYRRISIDWTADVRMDKSPMVCDGSELEDMF